MDRETVEHHEGTAPASYRDLPHDQLLMALVHLHRAVAVGAPIELTLRAGAEDRLDDRPDEASRLGVRADGADGSDDGSDGPDCRDPEPPGRSSWPLGADALCDVVRGAGFTIDGMIAAEEPSITAVAHGIVVRATRARSLPDVVGPGMRLLVCGLNPSLYAADVGVGFARPGNRFWPAALAAGIVSRDRDPDHALAEHGVGMTDLVKRATPRADELSADEYTAGLARVERLVHWLRPGTVCFLGLAGWRSAVDRRATAGWQDRSLAGIPVYVMPNPSGLNAHATVSSLAEHLRTAAAGRARP